MAAIGIDLGTTNTCVAVVRDGQVEVLENKHGNRLTPSCVAFDEKNTTVGEAAKFALTQGPCDGNVIYSVKRIIGRKFDMKLVQEQHWPFKVTESIDGTPVIEVTLNRKKETFRPEEISALVLREIKSTAELRLGREVRDAVITVPARFTVLQRVETEAAAKIAGLNVIGMINEPTAAALAYGLSQDYTFAFSAPKRHALVYDLGGGTFDVAVMEIKGAYFKVIGQAGDLNLGGDDFTNNLAGLFTEIITGRRQEGQNVRNKNGWQKLINRAEETKHQLSFASETKIQLTNSTTKQKVTATIDQTKLNSLNMVLYLKTIDYVDEALKNAGLQREEIQDVVLAGGSTRIPFILDAVRRHFPDSKMHYEKHPAEIVAKGAAIYAARLSGFATYRMAKLNYFEEVSSSLGTDVMNGKTSFIIKKGSQLPAEGSKIYINTVNDQSSMQISVCEGEEEQFSWNQLVDTFDFPIRKDGAGKVRIQVKFKLEKSGMLSVTAREYKFFAKEKKIDMNIRGAFREERIAQQRTRLQAITEVQK